MMFSPLQFIFDTGAENTLLTRRELTDLLDVRYRRKVTIYGSDLTTELHAYVASGIHFEFANQMRIANQTVLVLEEDYFQFAEFAGLEVHGILGADILRRFVVTIDFQRRKIVLQDPSKYRAPKKTFRQIPADFSRYKPYITLPSNLLDNQPTSLKLLMDTGASLALLIIY